MRPVDKLCIVNRTGTSAARRSVVLVSYPLSTKLPRVCRSFHSQFTSNKLCATREYRGAGAQNGAELMQYFHRNDIHIHLKQNTFYVKALDEVFVQSGIKFLNINVKIF